LALREVIFVDRVRLAQYFEQISSPKFRLLPTASMGLTGPSASVTGTRERPIASQSEQYDALCEYLREHDLLTEHRPLEADPWGCGDPVPDLSEESDLELRRPFRLEVCEASPVIVPPTAGASDLLGEGLHLWFSQNELAQDVVHPLILIEEFPLADGSAHWLRWNSGFTLLGVINDMLNETPIPEWGWGEGEASLGHIEFPALMRKLDARLGPSRVIRTLYRIRVTYFDPILSHPVTVGYPIVIERA
jgi:hypothetical protein